MPRSQPGLNGLKQRWRARRAKLPWHELETEAARQGCSPADIFFDRAGAGEPGAAAVTEAPERAPVPWRGHNPLPAPQAG